VPATLQLDPQAAHATAPVALAARGLVKRYGQGDATVRALDGVSLSVDRGELVAVMGPSGSGKSTLMHILAGLDQPTSGSAWIGDIEVSSLGDRELTEVRRRHVGFVFQFFNLLPMLTAEENILLPSRIAGVPPDRKRVADIVARVGIADRLGHRPAQLSGGQQQRVAVARALVARPTVLFADEPTGNLDTRSGAEVLEILREAVDEYDGQTVLMVTHDARAATIADRIVFLADGQVAKTVGPSSHEQVLEALQEVTR
jgi:putative ABC transport system ATP-binding protein